MARFDYKFYLTYGDMPEVVLQEATGHLWLDLRLDGNEITLSCDPAHIELATKAQIALQNLIAAHQGMIEPLIVPASQPILDDEIPF